MTSEEIIRILKGVHEGKITPGDALVKLRELPFTDLGHTKLDNHREIRTGYPEVVFCEGKTPEQVAEIIRIMDGKDSNILATRATMDTYDAVKLAVPAAEYNKPARTITIRKKKVPLSKSYISVVTAGTSDIPVAEEAAVTADIFNNRVERIFDVGVAGIHRLYSKLDVIRKARVVVVAAGMEGALPSIVGGLVDKPVIAVPTSVGYGASFHGLAALLGMLTSCASGVSVVNIDNGFGAGYMASMINKL